MLWPQAWARRRLRRFSHDRRGAAAVEFALVVPLLLLLYLGTVEASALYTVDRRIVTISGTMGDLVARVNGSISQATLDDFFQASKGIMIPYEDDGLEQVVSLVKVNPDGSTEVMWSRASGASPRTKGTSYPLPATAEMNKLARGGYLVASETRFSYLPVMGMVFEDPIGLHHESFFLPRYGEAIAEPS